MNNGKSIKVSILGKSYSLVTDEPEEVVAKSAQLLDSLLLPMLTTSDMPADVVKKTTFVALQLAVELMKKKTELESVERCTQTLNSLLKDTLTSPL